MFVINGNLWKIVIVEPDSELLYRSDGSRTVAVTDGNERTVFVSNEVQGSFLKKVISHEIVHCFAFSYDLYFDEQTEEFIADFVATYGRNVIYLADKICESWSRYGNGKENAEVRF